MNILTERDFLSETESNWTQVRNLMDIGVIRPIKMFNDKFVFFRKHVRLIESIKQLETQGLNLEQIAPYVTDESLDVDVVLSEANVTERTLPYFQSLSYEELIDRCRTERVIGFRRMTREQMEICLAFPEQREEIVQSVRDSNRRRTRSSANTIQEVTPAPVAVETPAIAIPASAENSEIANLPYKELVQRAKEARIPNFRRMSKTELIVCFTASDEEVSQLIEMVRERTKNRYGNGSATTTQNQSLSQPNIFDDSYSQLLEEEQEFLSEQPFYEDAVVEVVEDVVEDIEVPTPETEILPSSEDIEVVSEEVVLPEEVVVAPSIEEDNFTPFVEPATPTEPVPADVQAEEVPYTLEQLQAMNSKQVAVVVRDHLDIKYFRRMTKEELIICIFEPERRDEMVAVAAARYELYRGRRYGQNARN